MALKCVFLDAGNTLIHADPPVGHVYAEALRQRGIAAEDGEVGKQFKAAWRTIRRDHRGHTPPYGTTENEARAWWKRVVRLSFQPFGIPEEIDEVFEQLWTHFATAEAWSLYPDVLPALHKIRAGGLKLALISNWDARLEPVIEGTGLKDLLHSTTISYEAGAEKPSPEIFRRALSRTGVSPAESLHVGDSYNEDIRGAFGVGMRACWLRRGAGFGRRQGGAKVISSLSELCDSRQSPPRF
jgi:putative hydrolase of the HAD superfamily